MQVEIEDDLGEGGQAPAVERHAWERPRVIVSKVAATQHGPGELDDHTQSEASVAS